MVSPFARACFFPRCLALSARRSPPHTLSSARMGRCSRISSGSVSAAMTTNSEMPRLSVLVAE